MSEQQLKHFGTHAETLVELPDFAALDARGRNLRARRRVSVAATLAAVVAVVGVTVTQIRRDDTDTRPVKPPPSIGARTYAGGTMKTLDAGRYLLRPSLTNTDLAATLTVPPGWNAWVGPNRFNGHKPGRSNGKALGHATWYVGALVLEVDGINTHGCGDPNGPKLETTEQVVAALAQAFSVEVIRRPEPVQKFGHPATRMRLRMTKASETCTRETAVFHSPADGYIQYASGGNVLDAWVVDVDGVPIYVQKLWSPHAPQRARSELDGVIDSIRFHDAQ
jgi:hypothetical protein